MSEVIESSDVHNDSVTSEKDGHLEELNNAINLKRFNHDSQTASDLLSVESSGRESEFESISADDDFGHSEGNEHKLTNLSGSWSKSQEDEEGNGEQSFDEKKRFDYVDADDSKSVSSSSEIRGRPSACVFVASLSSNLSDDILCQSVSTHFKQWGDVSLVKVLRDPANRPYAFVQYSTDEDANRAINEGQHSILNGRTVRCEKARVNRTLYLQLPNPGMLESEIKELISSFGEIERIVSVNDNFNIIQSGDEPQKSWFFKFVYRQDAISAFANLKTRADWNIEWAQNLEDEYSNVPEVTIDRYSIFVGHLDPRITKDELIERFEKHGKIKEAILVNRPLSNFAFIKFKTKESAASAVERENHSMFKFKTIHVQYREMYNNYKRRTANDNGLKLNLAPPPVNFKRRNNFSNDRNNNHMKSVNFDTYSIYSKVKQQPHYTSKRFNFVNVPPKRIKQTVFNNNERKHGAERENVTTTAYVPPHNRTNSGGSSSKVNDNLVLNECIEEAETVTSKGDNETSTVRSNEAFSSGPKTGYTHSTIDDELDMEYYEPNSSNYQYPYYYYVPGKEPGPLMSKVDMVHAPLPPPPPAPHPSNNGYYYTYSNYHQAPLGANPPHMFPYYFYYNPMGVSESAQGHFSLEEEHNSTHPNSIEEVPVSNQCN